uniref:Nipped-B protein n=1 Tax=Sinocyclocheilus anshuiensis TaxID=1608454 RepID=A0A671LWZ4_9TELE
MNGDMPHVPITTLAGIASLTDLLNQLPLPSPLPATTTKSLLYNGRIAEEVSCLLSRRDDTLVSQLAHSLNQVSTEHIELKDNLGSDDPEGDVPLLLQTVLSRNPNVFREKSLMQQPMIPPYKMPQNSMHGSPASNYQQTTITPSPPSRYVQPQAGSGTRYMPQQNSPVPSPYAPQSPAGYMQYSYPQHQQIQQVSVSSPIVPGGMRNIHDNKVSCQVSGNSNHNARHCSNDEYISIVQRLGNDESDPAMRNASFPVRSVCSPAGSEGTPKVGSRPPLILQSPPPYTSPRDAAPDLLLDSPERKKKQKKLMKDEGGKGALYDIVSSPTKDSTKLTIKLSRVKSSETEQSAEPLSAVEHGSDAENELSCNSLPYHRNPQERLSAGQCLSGEQSAYQQVPVLQNTGALAAKQPGVVSGTPYDEAELDALAEIERIERESAIERERCSKEVQDKDKPLKKRKQDSYPQEPGAAGTAGSSGTPGVGGGCNAGNKLVPQEACAASNGASRPALMVSIDLQQAGRVEGPVDSCPVPATEAQRWPEDGSESTGVLRLKSKTDGEVQKTVDGRPEVIKQRVETVPQKTVSDGRPETPKHKHENRREISNKVSSEKKSDPSKHRHDGKPDKVRPEGKGHETPRKQEGRSESTRESKGERQKDRENEGSKVRRPDTSKSSRVEHNRDVDRDQEREKEGENRDKEREKDRDKVRDKEQEKDQDKLREKDRDKLREKDRDKVREKDRDKDRDKERVKTRDKEQEKDREKERVKDRDKERVKDRYREREKDQDKERERVRDKDRDKDRDQEKKRHTESTEARDKRSPEQRSRPDSPRVKQEPRSGAESRTKPERSVHKTPNNKDEKRSGDKNRLDGHKPPSSDSKTVEFPNYLLGGKSSALKNFVIPKLKRDKDGNVMQEMRRELFSEPLVKLEKLDLVEDLNKGAKPVVVLKKLSIDEVQKLISNSCSKSSKSKSSYGKFGEMDSRAPLCERVKMNKRRRSSTNDKPKYAEVSSDDDSSSVELPPKRSKKNRDKTWEYEEKDRRGSGDHRRSRGHYDSQRSSGSRYRECSPVDSDEDSPPPSLSDLARKLKKKEKQKKRKAYEPKLTLDEMMDSSTFKRFSTSVDNILENLEDVDLTLLDDDEIPQELLLGKHQLSELSSESAKIKAMGIMHKIPTDKMVKVQSILEKNIQDGAKLSTLMNHDNDRDDEERLWRELIMERVTKSADACLTALNIMTSARMPKAVYIEDVIERVVQYTKFHLQNTLYPQYDPVYRVDPRGGGTLSSKAKRAKCSTHKQRVTVMLYNKVCDIISNLSELLEIQLLTDTTILQVSSLGITPFFVENVSELQLCAIKLVTAVFSRYEKHRQLILEEIFTSLARLPTSKRNLRNFRLNSSDVDGEPMYIQMVTALVLQLIQCVVHLPSDKDFDYDNDRKVDKDVLITNSYETAMRTAQNFLSVFLKKCGSKQGEDDYRPLFENFVQDLLSTVNKPDWPAAELLLSLLGRLNKQTEMALRVASLDYLGTVAARLRKDAVTSKMDQRSINRILGESSGGDEIQQLQKALLGYLDENVETDPSLLFARKFYIAQWFRDTSTETEKAMKSQSQRDDDSSDGAHHARDVETTSEILQKAEVRKKFLRSVIKTTASKFSSLRVNSDTVDYEDSCLIVRYLASMRPFAQSFDIYLTQILRVLGESAIAVRTKAMKCLSEVVAVDPSILARSDMQRGVHGRLMDNSTSVREAAVELLGRFVLSRPQLTEQYYDMLIERILDTGISVRKRVIKILRDICLEQPTFNKITEMCVKMIRRVSDEEGIKKLVNETFQKLWFTPTPNHDKEAMTRKILNITDVVAACKDSGYDWFEQLLQNLLKSEEDASYKPARKACAQLVDSLVDHILKYEESLADCENKGLTSDRLVACITTLYLFSKIRPQLMVKHAMTMQPYLTTKCNTQSDFMVICNVAKILELVVPLMDHPSENFLTTIEEDLMKLIIKYGMTVSWRASINSSGVQRFTSIFNRSIHSFTRLVNGLLLFQVVIKDKVLELLLYFTKNEDEEVQTKAIIGLGFLLIQHPGLMFASDVKNLYNCLLADRKTSLNLKIQVLKNLQTYLQEEDSRMQEADREWKKMSKQEDLKEMGDISSGMSSSIMQLYLKQVLESFFHTQSSVRHFALNVIALTLSQGLVHPVQCVPYLIAMGTDSEPTMRNKADQQLVEIDKKYTGFIHMKAVAGMKMSYQVQQAIVDSKDTVIRGFRQDETNTALCSHLYTMVRVNRQHRRAFLISLLNLFDDNTKSDVNLLLYTADNLACFPYQSQEEPLFIMHHVDITLSVSGSNLLQSFKESLLKEPRPREKKKKRGKKYGSEEEDESSRGSSSDSDSSDDVIRRPKKPRRSAAVNSDSDSDLDLEDVDKVMQRLPDNPEPLLDFANASQGILLLLMLKQHLKNLYGFSDSKIQKYSPTESAKVYDKAVNRKANVHFNPRQTLDYLTNNLSNADLTYDVKRRVVRQYLDFKVLMEHLDPDEEDEEGDASASIHARNKAITALLGGSSPKNNAADSYDDDSDADEKAPGSSRRSRRGGDSAEASGHMNETVKAMDVIAICCPKYKDRPQIARVIQKTSTGYSIRWMAGSYSGTWAEAKKRDGRKLVPWVDTIKESDIIYKKIALTSAHKLSNKVVQTLRSLYAAKEGTSS